MTHVVTQSCVGDGSCVFACPVNCIQPTPDDPAFELAEMLHIDPATCVDCGACVTACPVDAIKPHLRLDDGERVFAAINAAFHAAPRERARLAPVRPPLVVHDRGEPLRVAIVGSGPAAMYAAEEVLTIPGALVDVYERSSVPYGLVVGGVAPDHRRTRRITRQLDRIAASPRLTMHLGVAVVERPPHHAVIWAVGAADDRRLDVPGSARAVPAGEIVRWYNGRAAAPDLSARRVVVIGNGNVALDIARILTVDPASLAGSDIAPAALEALGASAVQEVVVVGRRGAGHAAFTLPELVGLTATVPVGVDARGLGGDGPKLDLLRRLADERPRPTAAPARPAERGVTLRFGLVPERIDAQGVVFAGGERIDAGLVITSIGYRGVPVAGLPFDPVTGTVPNTGGRVQPGTYVAGWIKRGPRGFIGTNRACSQDTVAALVDDWNAGALECRGWIETMTSSSSARPGSPVS